MAQNGLGYMIEEWFVECLQQDLRRNVAPTFWKIFEVEPSEPLTKQLGKAVNYLHEITMGYMPCINRLNSTAVILEHRKPSTIFNQNNLSEAYILLIKSIIFFILPTRFCSAVELFYSQAFKVFHHSTSDDEDDQGWCIAEQCVNMTFSLLYPPQTVCGGNISLISSQNFHHPYRFICYMMTYPTSYYTF